MRGKRRAMELYPTPENPLPPGAECLTVITRDKLKLRAMRALPPDARGTVIIIGGRGDYVERYFETMRELMARGFAVASVDLRGQGGSERLSAEPYRGILRSFAGFDEDLRAFMETVVLPHCPSPVYALGHSTGGHVLLRVLRNQNWFRKAVLVSPLVDVIYGSWPRPIATLLVNAANLSGCGWMFLPGVLKTPMGRAHFGDNPLTSDEWRWNRDCGTLEMAPHLGLGGATFSWLGAARRSLAAVARMGRPQAPVLIVAAGVDCVVSNEAIRKLARSVPGIALTVIPEAKHEILTECDIIRRQFFAAFDSFVTADLGG
jgi:lysophospholipase